MDYDVIVVGAGPAGSSCATLFAKKGCKVLLVEKEKFPRDKPCGDAIGGKALSVLNKLDLEAELEKKGFLRNDGILFTSPAGHEVVIPLLSDSKLTKGFICKRIDFDKMLFDNASKYCETKQNAQVVDLIFENKRVVGVKVKERDSIKEYSANLIVGADGVSSIVAKKTGLLSVSPNHFVSAVRGYFDNIAGLRKNIEVHFLPQSMPGYFWIFPLSESKANVGVGMLLSEIQKRKINLWKLLEDCLKDKRFQGRFENAKLEGKISGWGIPLASSKRKCSGDGFILLGDAASLVDPFSGEGIGNGMKSALIASEVLGEKILQKKLTYADCQEYEKALWQEIGNDVKSSFYMQQIGKTQFLLDLVISKAAKNQEIRNELAEMFANKEAKKKATSIFFYLKFLFS